MKTFPARIRRHPPLGSWFAVLAFFAGLPAVWAGQITQSLAFRLNATTSTEALHFSAFDGSLGTLQSVEVSFDATRRHAWAIWNVSGTPGALPYEMSLTGTTFTIGGNGYGFANVQQGPSTTPMLDSTPFPDFLNQFLTGQTQFLEGDAPDFTAVAFQPATSLTAISGAFNPDDFDNVLNLALAYTPGVFSIDSNGHFAGSLVDVFGTARVTYNFTPVPEEGVGVGMLLGSWAVLLLVSRKARGLG